MAVMKDIYRIYKLARFIDNDIREAKRQNPELNDPDFQACHQVEPLIELYAATKRMNFDDALAIAQTAKSMGYLESLNENEQMIRLSIDRGQFLVGNWKGFPYGLITELTKRNVKLLLAAAAALAVIAAIVAIIFR
jgi:hypothetical protein